jgi:hypothetical protein
MKQEKTMHIREVEKTTEFENLALAQADTGRRPKLG